MTGPGTHAAQPAPRDLPSELVDAAPDALVVIDPSGAIVLINRQAESLFGYRRDDLLGQRVEVLVPEHLRERHVDLRTGYSQAPVVRPMATGQALYGRRSDGTEFPAEISLSPVETTNGTLFVAAIRDATDRQRTVRELAHLLVKAEDAEARFKGLLESAPDAVVIARQDGRIMLANRQVEALFGYRPAELVDQPVELLIPERFHARHVQHRTAYQSAPRARPMGAGLDLFGRRKDGSEFEVEVSLSLFESEGETLVNAAIRDISARRAVEAAVRRQAALLDLAPTAVIVRDPGDAVVYWNAAAERMYGWTTVEATGQVTHTLLATRCPESREATKAHLEATGFWEGDLRHTRKDGSEIVVASRQALQRDDAGHPLATLEINTDVTQLRHAEAELARSEVRFRLLVEGVQDYALFGLSPEGLVTSWNAGAERLKGYAAAEIIGQHFARFYIPDEIAGGIPERILETARREGRATAEGWRIRRDGSRFWAEVVLTAQRNHCGELIGFAKLTRDVTARREQELALQQTAAELARSNADLQQFAYIASHDLQEPLRMVSSYTQLLARRYVGRLDDDADEFIHYAVDGAKRMQALINALLVYARVGSRPMEPQPVDTNAIVDEVLVDLCTVIAESNAHIMHDDLPSVAADTVLLHQVFQNLIGNALKFRGAQPPVVHISAQRLGGEYAFAIRDHGIGIEPQYLERIFTIFQRLHSEQEYAGTGIGLAVCRKVIERLGGRIWAESQPGEGTTFRFTLPATPQSWPTGLT